MKSAAQLTLFDRSVLEGVFKSGTTAGCYEAVSSKLGLTQDDLASKVKRGQVFVGKWQHKVRQVQQKLKALELIEPEERGNWSVTSKGRQALTFAQHKTPKIYFETKNGVAFWGDSSELPALFHGQVDVIITSPPYLLTEEREYRNLGNTEQAYVDSLVKSIEGWLPMLTPTASVVLNIGDSYKKGAGHLSLHKERLLIALEDRLGLHLVQKFVWYSPSKMPSGYWTTVARRDCVTATEDFFWLSLDPKNCSAKNDRILTTYSEKQRQYIENAQGKSGVRLMPSGQSSNDETFYKDNGGAIPSNLLFAAPEGAHSAYSRYCREHGLPRHPAMYHHALPEFFVRYLTEKGQVVFDPYSGSGNTALASEIQDRHWISSEIVREYVDGHFGRMKVNGFNPVPICR